MHICIRRIYLLVQNRAERDVKYIGYKSDGSISLANNSSLILYIHRCAAIFNGGGGGMMFFMAPLFHATTDRGYELLDRTDKS
ncbi:hypothetical protein EUGRSUZ_A02918 [Eucalyptus grandis]|uniref:Uncharacterized protein n=2 Tax=Eucalyptus grandis TaxID=71139 RepID=A0ACC3M7T8_EUCGR|nr:hypothetical protein EUGRSUZ_A02918 [Eucalyptus grandis]